MMKSAPPYLVYIATVSTEDRAATDPADPSRRREPQHIGGSCKRRVATWDKALKQRCWGPAPEARFGLIVRDLDAAARPAAQPATSELSVQQLTIIFC